MSEKLTQFQELFCREYIKTGNASAAYRAVSPKAATWLEKTLWEKASRMLARGKVKARIAEMQADAAQSSMVTVDLLNRKLENYQKEAREDKQFAVCVAAVMGQAKLFGFLVDKKEIRTGALDGLSFEDLRIVNDALTSLGRSGQDTGADSGEVTH
jgi:uncharacterized protein YicC (UPF0701 family)